MRLDSVVLYPDLMWLGTEDEKVAFFGMMAASLPRERLPHITVGKGSSRMRLLPEDQPIGVTSTGRVVFTYVGTAARVEEFRAFVQRHADLLQALPGWTLRVMFPQQIAGAMSQFEGAARYELTAPLRPDTLAELKCYSTPIDRRLRLTVCDGDDEESRLKPRWKVKCRRDSPVKSETSD